MKYVGALVGTMSGSMGGATASRNRGGQYLRQRVVPTNPATTRQNAQRSYLSGANTAWAMLTAAQRTAWATYAANVPTTDTLGNTIYLTGQQMYIRTYTLWMYYILVGNPSTAPTTFNRGPNPVSITSDTDTIPNTLEIISGDLDNTVTLSETDDDGGVLQVFIGRPVAPTINYFAGPYQYAFEQIYAGLGSTIAITTTLTDMTIDEPLAVGQRRPVRMLLRSNDGRVSTDYKVICDVIDNTP